MVSIRLSMIPLTLREMVADECLSRMKLRGIEAMIWKLTATRGEAVLVVPEWKAELVLAGKRPPGETPKDIFL